MLWLAADKDETPKPPEPFSHRTHKVTGASLLSKVKTEHPFQRISITPDSDSNRSFTPMKKVQMFKNTSKAILATAVTTALVLGGVSVSAFAADATPAPSASPVAKAPKTPNPNKVAMDAFHAAQEAFKGAQEQFKASKSTFDSALAAFKSANQTYGAAKKVIGDTFRSAVQAANNAYEAAKAAATTDADKAAALAARKAAVAAAATVRDAAIAALGAAPVKPVAPTRPVKPTKPEHIDVTKGPKTAPTPAPTATP
jgi:hypothetical protein